MGIFDVMNPESSKDMGHFQKEDMLSLGKLILTLVCRSPNALTDLSQSLEYLGNIN